MKDIFHNSKLFGEHVSYVQGILKDVINKNKIRIQLMSPLSDKSDEKDEDDLELCNERDLEFDYLAICTGSSYVFNENSPEIENTLVTKEKRIEFLNRYKEEISQASSILVIGSGWTAVEFLGEIYRKFGKTKKYGLLHKDPFLKKFPNKVRDLAKGNLECKGVTFYSDLGSERRNEVIAEYDYTLMCTGTKCYTPFFDNQNFKEWKSEDGQIFVNEYFQVTNRHPWEAMPPSLHLRREVTYENIFCYGDAWLTRMNEVKNISVIEQMCPIVANNILAKLNQTEDMLEMPYAVDKIQNIHFGSWYGVLVSAC